MPCLFYMNACFFMQIELFFNAETQNVKDFVFKPCACAEISILARLARKMQLHEKKKKNNPEMQDCSFAKARSQYLSH